MQAMMTTTTKIDPVHYEECANASANSGGVLTLDRLQATPMRLSACAELKIGASRSFGG
jgi:hypothetical protein